MQHRQLALLSLAVVSGIVLVLFGLRLRPAWQPPSSTPTVIALTKPSVTFIDPAFGPATAKVTIVLFGDFQCIPCAEASINALAVAKAYPKDVRVIWKHLPNIDAHPLALNAAIAAQCAARRGKFWEYHDALFARQTILAETQFPQIANEVGLDVASFGACYDVQDTLALIKKDAEEAQGLGLTATPTLFINDQKIVGIVSVDELTGYVKAALGK